MKATNYSNAKCVFNKTDNYCVYIYKPVSLHDFFFNSKSTLQLLQLEFTKGLSIKHECVVNGITQVWWC